MPCSVSSPSHIHKIPHAPQQLQPGGLIGDSERTDVFLLPNAHNSIDIPRDPNGSVGINGSPGICKTFIGVILWQLRKSQVAVFFQHIKIQAVVTLG